MGLWHYQHTNLHVYIDVSRNDSKIVKHQTFINFHQILIILLIKTQDDISRFALESDSLDYFSNMCTTFLMLCFFLGTLANLREERSPDLPPDDNISIDHMHMTSQKGAPACWGSNEALPRAPSPCMQPKGQPLHAIPPCWQ